jgi:hypothetical protein
VLLSQRLRGIDRATAQQAEVAGIARHLSARGTFEQAIECRRCQALELGLAIACNPLCRDDVITLVPSLEQFGDELWRILEVRIDDDDRSAERVIETGGQHQPLPEVATEIDDRDALVALTQIEQQRQLQSVLPAFTYTISAGSSRRSSMAARRKWKATMTARSLFIAESPATAARA